MKVTEIEFDVFEWYFRNSLRLSTINSEVSNNDMFTTSTRKFSGPKCGGNVIVLEYLLLKVLLKTAYKHVINMMSIAKKRALAVPHFSSSCISS